MNLEKKQNELTEMKAKRDEMIKHIGEVESQLKFLDMLIKVVAGSIENHSTEASESEPKATASNA